MRFSALAKRARIASDAKFARGCRDPTRRGGRPRGRPAGAARSAFPCRSRRGSRNPRDLRQAFTVGKRVPSAAAAEHQRPFYARLTALTVRPRSGHHAARPRPLAVPRLAISSLASRSRVAGSGPRHRSVTHPRLEPARSRPRERNRSTLCGVRGRGPAPKARGFAVRTAGRCYSSPRAHSSSSSSPRKCPTSWMSVIPICSTSSFRLRAKRSRFFW
jgi:hypothetical protein